MRSLTLSLFAGASVVGCCSAPADAALTKAELGAMLKKCSAEADAKGLTVQKGKGDARTSFRRQCMLKNGVSPRSK